MKDNTKQVWRMNLGDPCLDLSKDPRVLYSNGSIGNSSQKLDAADFDWSIQGLWDDISAYQTNRTKPAKYGDFACENCEGCGNELEYDVETGEMYPVGSVCGECGGIGYVREAL